MSYVMDLHEAHKARLVRMQPRPTPEAAQEARDNAIAQVWPELPPPPSYDGAIFRGTQHWKIIVREVCEKHSVSIAEIIGNRRARHLVIARHEAFHRLSTETTMSLPQIGYRMGGKDHTTVLHGIRAHKKRMGSK